MRSRLSFAACKRAARASLSLALASPFAFAAWTLPQTLASASIDASFAESPSPATDAFLYSYAPRSEAAAPTPRTRRYADVKAFLSDLAARYPGAARGVEIGDSDSGERIVGLAIGDPRSAVRDVVVAAHHGNEYGSVETALGLAESLAQSPLADRLVFVVPVLNVAGYDSRTRWERGADRRFHDPNRDYPGPCGTEGPFALKSTRALAEFVERQNAVATATLHTYYPAVLWPWGIAAQDLSTPYDLRYKELAQAATQESGYQIGNSTEVLYAALGAYEDWAYWKLGAWSLLFELGGSHNPTDAEVARTVAANVAGIRRMLALSPKAPAPAHEFTSRCDSLRARFDRHDE